MEKSNKIVKAKQEDCRKKYNSTNKFKSFLEEEFVVLFDNKKQCSNFIKKVKNFGGKWFTGKEITEKDYNLKTMQQFFAIQIDSKLEIGFLDGCAIHFSKLKKIRYKDLKTRRYQT